MDPSRPTDSLLRLKESARLPSMTGRELNGSPPMVEAILAARIKMKRFLGLTGKFKLCAPVGLWLMLYGVEGSMELRLPRALWLRL